MKLLFIGVDCLDGYYVMDHLRELPNFMRLKKRGGSMGPCKSVTAGTTQPHTGPAWLSIYTGVHPVIHGVTSGGWTSGVKYYSNRKVNSIWDLMNENGLSVFLFNLPITWPPPKLLGWCISGFITPEKDYCYPSEIQEKLPEYYLTDVFPTYNDRRNVSSEILKIAKKIAEYKPEIFLNLYNENSTEIAGVGMTVLDRFYHVSSNAYIKGYKIVDKLLGFYLDNLIFDHLVVISDHGGKKRTKGWGGHSMNSFYYNSWGDEIKVITDLAHSIKKVLTLKGELGERRIEEETPIDEDFQEKVLESLKRLGYID